MKQGNIIIQTEAVALVHETKFGGIYTKLPIDAFHACGFEYGDSVDVELDNGYRLTDVPYYNAFFVRSGMPLVAGYPLDTCIYFGFNDGEDVWIVSGAGENTKARFFLREKGKYKAVQDTFNLSYSDERLDYESDEAFANFRTLTGGKIRPNIVFRSASPCDNVRNRAALVDKMIRERKVQYIVNLADSPQEAEGYLALESFDSPYYKQLLDEKRVALLDLSSDFRRTVFKTRLADAFSAMLNSDGPYLIHCLEGKDRTGFAAVLLEGLCGATYDEMLADYMLTYDNYYHVNPVCRTESYDAVKCLLFDAMVGYLAGTEELSCLKTACYVELAKKYLKDGGMTDEQIERLRAKICF